MAKECHHCLQPISEVIWHDTLGALCPSCMRPLGRRKRMLGSSALAYPSVALLKLAERDEWICHLCGKEVDPRARGLRRATRDHVIPRSRGGGNGKANLKLAHYNCNVARKATLLC